MTRFLLRASIGARQSHRRTLRKTKRLGPVCCDCNSMRAEAFQRGDNVRDEQFFA
jgi:hypothetical protein